MIFEAILPPLITESIQLDCYQFDMVGFFPFLDALVNFHASVMTLNCPFNLNNYKCYIIQPKNLLVKLALLARAYCVS